MASGDEASKGPALASVAKPCTRPAPASRPACWIKARREVIYWRSKLNLHLFYRPYRNIHSTAQFHVTFVEFEEV